MNPLRALSKPQYLLRPSQIFRRLIRKFQPRQSNTRLPWGPHIEVDPADTVANALLAQGIYDLVTTEVLWRITNPGDRTIDIGANVGYTVSILAWRSGPGGSVLAFEPHPRTYSILEKNAGRWNVSGRCGAIACIHGAVSDYDGTAHLSPSHGPNDPNISHASITQNSESPNVIEVRCWKLTSFLSEAQTVNVLKIDTEGHEARILAGAQSALRNGWIQNVVYEEMADGPADSHAILRECGYTLFAFEERLSGPAVFAWPHLPAVRRAYDLRPSYLATRDPNRAEQIFKKSGWHSLNGV